jgi:hypothetical protein
VQGGTTGLLATVTYAAHEAGKAGAFEAIRELAQQGPGVLLPYPGQQQGTTGGAAAAAAAAAVGGSGAAAVIAAALVLLLLLRLRKLLRPPNQRGASRTGASSNPSAPCGVGTLSHHQAPASAVKS